MLCRPAFASFLLPVACLPGRLHVAFHAAAGWSELASDRQRQWVNYASIDLARLVYTFRSTEPEHSLLLALKCDLVSFSLLGFILPYNRWFKSSKISTVTSSSLARRLYAVEMKPCRSFSTSVFYTTTTIYYAVMGVRSPRTFYHS